MYTNWVKLYHLDRRFTRKKSLVDNSLPLYYASLFGLNRATVSLLEDGSEVNMQGLKDSNALHAASSRGHENIVRLLLGNGAKVNMQ